MHGAESPRVTLIVTTFDRPEFVEETMASARAQTYSNLEVVVSDDGSSVNEMLTLLEKLESKGVRVLRNPHGGVSANIHRAMAATESKYVMILNDDDLIDPPYIEEAVAVAEDDANIGMVYCRATKFGSVNELWNLPDYNVAGLLTHNMVFATMLFRRDDWRAVGGHDIEMLHGREDHDFVLKLAGLGRTAHRLEGVYFHYRQHGLASVNRIGGEDRRKRATAHASMLRNNSGLYLEHAEDFWFNYFNDIQEANKIRMRYAFLEKLRAKSPRVARLLNRRVIALKKLFSRS